MKKILFATFVLVLAGLVGVLVAPWALDIPGAIEAKLASYLFQAKATRVLNCINRELTYSEAVGFTQVGPGSVLIVMTMALDPETYRGEDNYAKFADTAEQLATVLGCADELGGGSWRSISIQGVSIDTLGGYSKSGERAELISLTLQWAVGAERDIATEFVAAADHPAYLEAAFEDGSMGLVLLGYYNPPVNPTTVNGKLVIKAAEKFIAYADELTRLAKQSK